MKYLLLFSALYFGVGLLKADPAISSATERDSSATAAACELDPSYLEKQLDEQFSQVKDLLKRAGFNKASTKADQNQATWKSERETQAIKAASSKDKKQIDTEIYHRIYLDITKRKIQELEAQIESLKDKIKAEQDAAANP